VGVDGLRDRAAALDWYHTIELAPGVVTAGEYDLRPVVGRLPLDVRGARALDVGTHDGFYAFELERRGAREVVAIDLERPSEWDWPARPPAALAAAGAVAEQRKAAFSLAREARSSAVELRYVSVYDLDPAEHGTFDLAVIGTLLLHLRDPIGALRAIRRVARAVVVNDVVSLPLSVRWPRTPHLRLLAREGLPFWWIPNRAALVRYVEAAGWTVADSGRPYLVPFGAGRVSAPLRDRLRSSAPVLDELVMSRGAPHAWVLGRDAAGA
jgi:tRNA (mo5U34)-methyltransferase